MKIVKLNVEEVDIDNEPYTPRHPFWCDGCGHHAPFTIRGCPIDHVACCDRYGEDAEKVYRQAVRYCEVTGKAIP